MSFQSDFVLNGEVPNLVKVFSNVCVLLVASASCLVVKALKRLNTLLNPQDLIINHCPHAHYAYIVSSASS